MQQKCVPEEKIELKSRIQTVIGQVSCMPQWGVEAMGGEKGTLTLTEVFSRKYYL